MTRPRVVAAGLVVLLLAVALVALRGVGDWRSEPSAGGPDGVSDSTQDTNVVGARAFLDTYVEDDGRVVRTDQGGDTVSEGQAYALLIALGAEDRATFDSVWQWTQTNLMRPEDGLLSWRWVAGTLADESSAADADLDVARALVLAADVFDDSRYADDGIQLGQAILDHETTRTPAGLVLLAGSWAREAPYDFNPSYVSPVATQVLGEASGDPRWTELEEGSRAAVEALTAEGQLPPDWAEIDPDGAVRPVPGPGGEPVRFGYDAPRTLIRHAESCEPQDHRIATAGSTVLGDEEAVAVYDLAGSPQTGDASPLSSVAQAAGAAAGGDKDAARIRIVDAEQAQRASPTYYGDAWAVLGPMLLSDSDLGGCPPLAGSA